MTLLSERSVTPKQQEWIDAHLGAEMRVTGMADHGGAKRRGVVVDYKLDLGRRGVIFVLDLGADRDGHERYRETYRALPGSWQTGPRT